MKNKLLVERFQKLAGLKEEESPQSKVLGFYEFNEDNEEIILSDINKNSIATTFGAWEGAIKNNEPLYFSSMLDNQDEGEFADINDYVPSEIVSIVDGGGIGKDGGDYFIEFSLDFNTIKKYFKEQQ